VVWQFGLVDNTRREHRQYHTVDTGLPRSVDMLSVSPLMPLVVNLFLVPSNTGPQTVQRCHKLGIGIIAVVLQDARQCSDLYCGCRVLLGCECVE
jgi:hypothetical protein